MFNMQVADPAGLSSILKYNLYSRIEVNPNNREYVIYVSDAVPANSGVHSHYSKAIFRVSGDLDSYPTKIEITSTDGMVSVSEYSDFVTLSGTEVPQSVRVTLAGDSDGSDQYRFDYLEIDSQFDHDECFLTYYGFPEPDGEPEFPWRWFMLAGFIVCSSLLLFVGKRQQYFNRKTKQEV
jgi:hypothetical protein